jgi:hypothetical protein
MITKKKLVVPIFEYKLTIIIFDDWRELEPYLPEEEFKVPAKAITLSQYGASMVMIDAKHGSSIVHEAVHVKNHIWNYIGYRPQADNDEVDAYVITYIYNKIVDVYYKHLDSIGVKHR